MSNSIDRTSVAFVCVQNAGRSQMAAAIAERERDERDLVDDVRVISGGTSPADAVHDVVVEAMAEIGIDLSDRRPRSISSERIEACDVVVTMGCDAQGVCPAGWRGDTRDWGLEDSHGSSLEDVRTIRGEIERRTVALFDELEADVR